MGTVDREAGVTVGLWTLAGALVGAPLAALLARFVNRREVSRTGRGRLTESSWRYAAGKPGVPTNGRAGGR